MRVLITLMFDQNVYVNVFCRVFKIWLSNPMLIVWPLLGGMVHKCMMFNTLHSALLGISSTRFYCARFIII